MTTEGIEAANRMTDVLGDFTKELQKLTKRDRRVRLILRILAVSLIIDVSLTVAVSLSAVSNRNNSAAIHRSQIAACATANSQRDSERAIWDYVLDDLTRPSPGESAQQKARSKAAVAVIEAKVAATFADHNCAAVYKLP